MEPSTLWLIAIIFGVSLAALANIQYARARDAEKKTVAAQQARSLLDPEVRRNGERLDQMLQALDKDQIPLDAFDTTAWQTVSRGDLLLGLPSEDLSRILQVYHLANRANSLHSRLLESVVGMASALQGSLETRKLLISNLRGVLKELAPLVKAVSSRPGPNTPIQPAGSSGG